MGVWIETYHLANYWAYYESHPVWVCGLKHIALFLISKVNGHTLYGCVDWNLVELCVDAFNNVTPCMGVWIETLKKIYLQ